MDGFDFSPLFRSTIGFDRLFRLLDAASRVDGASPSYPPFNIEKTGEDAYRLTMAVAGFSPSELDVTVHENTLLVTGKVQKEEEKKNGNGYLHRGIARRAFERRDAAVQVPVAVLLLLFLMRLARHQERVLVNGDIELGRREASHGHCQPVGVFTDIIHFHTDYLHFPLFVRHWGKTLWRRERVLMRDSVEQVGFLNS